MLSELLPDLDEVFNKLLLADVTDQLPGTGESTHQITTDDIRKLIGYASILALEDNSKEKKTSYEICTRLIAISNNENESLIEATDFILSRLGNFPGRKLLRDRYTDITPLVPALLRFERSTREIGNTIETGQKKAVLTDFQLQLFEELGKKQTVSVSAPTSAGKSFTLGLDLLRRILQSKKTQSIVYVVPTRALIREVSMKFRNFLKEEISDDETIPIRTVPFPIDREKVHSGIIYVLTQERLMSLLFTTQGIPWITTLFIDEAHGIQDKSRGVILESAIETTLQKFPTIELHFASPLISNPEIFPALFNRPNSKSILEEFSPVSQNIILVSEVLRKVKQASFSLLNNSSELNLGIRDLDFEFRKPACTLKANFAISVTAPDETTILFANGPAATEKLAEALVSATQKDSTISPEILELIDFLKNEIHTDYLLIKTLQHKVAFHYGSMPSLIRTKIEDLVKQGKIKYICCTSTLLQGVNLPAKHIIIENPKSGSAFNMTRQDFLNLIGRAGRLQYEFHGNIWCIKPSKWDSKPYEGEALQKVEPAMNQVMSNGGEIIQDLLDEKIENNKTELAEAAFSKFYSDTLFSDSPIEDSKYFTTDNKNKINDTLEKCKALKITLPQEVLDSNRGIRPDRLQNLYDHLKSTFPIIELMPIRPGLENSTTRMKEIIKVTEEYLENIHNNSYIYYSQLASSWVHNTPIKKIISSEIYYKNNSNDSSSSTMSIIRELFKSLNSNIRYKLVKNFMAYNSILALVMRERDMKDQADSIEPFHLYLECGASNPTALSLISLGLSRTTSLSLIGAIRFEDAESPEECLRILKKRDLSSLTIPVICRKEIEALL